MGYGKLKLAASVLLLALSAGCSGDSSNPAASPSGGRVVVYSSVDEVFAEPILKQFEKGSGIEVVLVPDTEETKSTGLLNRLIAEKERPQADVFWSGDPVRAAILKAKGVSTAYQSDAAEGLPSGFSDADHHWTCFSARARVIIYNTDLVAEGGIPTSIHDLADPRFRGDACIANPLFGTTSMHVAALFQAMGDEQAKAFMQSLVDNEVKILSSNGEVRRRVANGDFAIGLTDTDDVHVAMTEGKPVDFVYPDDNADGLGTLVMPNAVVLIADGPNPEAGKQVIDYLLKAQTEAALARGEAAQMPLRADVDLPEAFRFRSVAKLSTMAVDYGKLADKLDELSHGFLKDWVDGNL